MSILERIVETTRTDVARRKREVPPSSLRDFPDYARRPSGLRASLAAAPEFGIIAEFKRSSPSRGTIRAEAEPGAIARAYSEAGAAGISVLTDGPYFGGSLRDLEEVRGATELPCLRKDFIIDPYQVAEAKASGADAVLLIAAILDKGQLAELFFAAAELGLESLVELYDEKEIDILDTGRMTLIGVNNRDLKTFEVSIDRAARVARHLPPETTVVSESGISGPGDIRRLLSQGIRAALVGEYCMRAEHPGAALRGLLEGASR